VRHIPLSDSIANIPEFHDCQRFIRRDRDGKLAYDSLYAIFASFRLNNLLNDLDSSKDSIVVNGGIRVPIVPVATVFSDHQYYLPLGIRDGFSCLLLYRLPGPENWGAKMIPLGLPDSNCFSAKSDIQGTTLQVRASSASGLTEDDYPLAARWDWDTVSLVQYIGIKCGAAWCQIGKKSTFDTSASYSGPPLPFKPLGETVWTPMSGAPGRPITDSERRRVTEIRGWYDQQLLDSGGSYKPTSHLGTLVPNPHIDGLKASPDAYQSRWVQVGFAVVTRGAYKWDYKQLVNEVSLCHGTANNCHVDENQHPERPSTMVLRSCENGERPVWWAAVMPLRVYTNTQGAAFIPDGKPKFFCLLETSHKAQLDDLKARFPDMVSRIPGTARWRWLLNDAGSWHGCIEASCCTPR
jgi:hypothetical protein